MTISTTTAKKVYTANGSATIFGWDFYVPNTASLIVNKTALDGTLSVLTLGTDYTVSGIGTNSGSVTITGSPLASGILITLQRSVPLLQGTDLTNQDGFYPEVIEAALDLLTMMVQQNTEAIGRAIKSPISDTGTLTMPTAASRASKILGFDGSGNPVPSGNVSDLINLSAAVAAAQTYMAGAQSARDSALAAYTSFIDHYIGASATAPTQNADGTALVGGELYFDTVGQGMKIWNGSTWVNGYTQAGAYLAIASNLSDLTNKATARTNLQLSSADAVTFSSVADAKGDVRKAVLNQQTTGYTLIAGDSGKTIWLTGSGAVTIPTGVFAGGEMVTIYNNTGSAKTITQGASITVNLAPTGTGNRTLADGGVCTVLFLSGTWAVISGAGLT